MPAVTFSLLSANVPRILLRGTAYSQGNPHFIVTMIKYMEHSVDNREVFFRSLVGSGALEYLLQSIPLFPLSADPQQLEIAILSADLAFNFFGSDAIRMNAPLLFGCADLELTPLDISGGVAFQRK